MKKEINAGRKLEKTIPTHSSSEVAPCQRGFFMGGDTFIFGGDTMCIDDDYFRVLQEGSIAREEEMQRWIGEGDYVYVQHPVWGDFDARVLEVDGEDVLVEYVDAKDGLSEMWVHVSTLQK